LAKSKLWEIGGKLPALWNGEDTTPAARPRQGTEDAVHLAPFAARAVGRLSSAAPAKLLSDGDGLLARRLRGLLYLLGAVVAVYLLLPQAGGLSQTWDVLRTVRWGWLLAGALVVPATYFAAAIALQGAVNHPLGLRRTASVQLAGSFLNKLTPKGLGGIGVNERYLVRSGVERPVAVAGIALNMAAGMVVHMTSLLAVSAVLGLRSGRSINLPVSWPYLVAFGVVIALLGNIILALLPGIRRKAVAALVTGATGLWDVLRTPAQAIKLFAGVAGVTLANVVTLTIALHAFGIHPSLLKVSAVYLGGEALASASPTPGRLGAIEAVLVANLTAMGVQTGPAVAGVLIYRLLGFWLPIIPGLLALRYLRRQQVL
jgi:undecaprenyl-diphosphatase